jgi:hypothetical protein
MKIRVMCDFVEFIKVESQGTPGLIFLFFDSILTCLTL